MKSSDAEGKKHKKDRLNNYEGAKSQSGSSTRASRRASVSKMKILKRKKGPTNEIGLELMRTG